MSRLRDVTGTNPTVNSLEQLTVYLFPFPIAHIAGHFSFLFFKRITTLYTY